MRVLGEPRPWVNFPVAGLPPGMTSSEESFQWAREMISRCIRRHVKCSPGLASVLPRRVLKIGSDLSVKLVETVQNENARYVCISHHWVGAE